MIWLRARLAGLVLAIAAIAAAVLRIEYLKKKRDKAEIRAEVLEARASYARVKKKIVGANKLALKVKQAENKEKVKNGEEITSLSNPNDY